MPKSFEDDSLLSQKLSINNFPKILVYGEDFREPMLNMYNAIEKNNLWNYIQNDYHTSYCEDPEVDIISKAVDNDGHSGATFGYCMRLMKEISIIGLSAFYNKYK